MADSRINVYQNLATMLNAGMPITRTLQTVEKHGRFGRVIGLLEQEVSRGQSLADAVETYKKRLAKIDIALIKVGEHTGQLAESFTLLSEWYAFRQRIKRAVFAGLTIPILEIHLAALIIPIVPLAFSNWDFSVYIRGVLGILAIVYIPVLIIYGLIRITPREGLIRLIFDAFIVNFPYIGKTVRELELGRYCNVFSTMYKAGVPIVRCSEMALDSVGNLVIKKRLEKGHEQVKVGNEMSSGFGSGLPAQFREMWRVGEESGDLDESCRRLGMMHTENAENRFQVLSKVVPMIIYLGVMLILAYFIFVGYSRIYGGLGI